MGLPQMAQSRSCQPPIWRGFSTAPSPRRTSSGIPQLMSKRLVPGAGPEAGRLSTNSETSIVTKHWHFRAGEGGGWVNSMLLQPCRKPAWPSCQPAAVCGPWGQREGGGGEKGKHSPLPPPKIDLELFLGAYSSHAFLFKSQDMGSVRKPFSRR